MTDSEPTTRLCQPCAWPMVFRNGVYVCKHCDGIHLMPPQQPPFREPKELK